MKSLTVGKGITIGFGFLCLLCIAISWFAIERVLDLKQISSGIVHDSLPALIDAGKINAALAENQLVLHRLLWTDAQQRRATLDQLAQDLAVVTEATKNYRTFVFSEVERRNFEAFQQRRDEYLQVRQRYIVLSETNIVEAEVLLDRPVHQAYAAYNKATDVLLNYHAEEASRHGEEIAREARSTVQLIALVSGIGLAIGIGGALLIVRSITQVLAFVAGSLNEGSEQVASASSQVSSASQSLAEGASEQAASLEETSFSLEEMASMVRRNAENAQSAKELAAQTRSAADAGARDMHAMS